MKPPLYRSPRKPKGQGAERREEILAAALKLFGEHGLQAVSTRRIAEAAGLSQPALYAYFATKDEIADTLCARAFAELERQLRAALSLADPADRLDVIGRAYIEFGLANPDAYRVAFMIERASDAGAPVRGDEIGDGAFGILRQAVRDHCARNAAQDFDPEVLAESCWASVHGLVSLLIAKPRFPWTDRAALIETHMARMHRSMAEMAR